MIAFDVTQANDPRRTGIGRVVEECLRSIVWLMENKRWSLGKLVLLSAWPFRLTSPLLNSLSAQGVEMVVLPMGSMYVYRATRLSLWTLRRKPDLLFIPEPIFPGIHGARRLAVMHYDLITRRHPTTASRHIRLLYRFFLVPTLGRATRVGVDSQFVREETAELVPAFEEKSEVLPIYINDPARFRPEAPEGVDPDAPFSLFIGNLMPHKNVRRLLQAFEQWHAEAPGEFHPLYIVGRARPEVDDIAPRLRELSERGIVRHFGYISDENISWLYANARCFAFPSLVEGFGLPILEAMSQDCPVVTAAGGATEETAGGAALLVDPCSVESILAGIRRVSADAALREDLRQRGRHHVATFTRERHATALLEFLRKAHP
jgi:glycosyltransferase involved in cell wall biosynthesis